MIFTTGDVVHSKLPKFGEKPYAELEMFQLIRFEVGFHFLGLVDAPNESSKLDRIGE